MNLRHISRVGADAPFTPPFNPSETFPVNREHVLPEQRVTGSGPWTYAMILLAAFGVWKISGR